jgi:hypothetical protein
MIIFGIVVQKMGEVQSRPYFVSFFSDMASAMDMGEGENKHIVKRVRVEQPGKVNQKSTRLPRVNSDQWPA